MTCCPSRWGQRSPLIASEDTWELTCQQAPLTPPPESLGSLCFTSCRQSQGPSVAGIATTATHIGDVWHQCIDLTSHEQTIPNVLMSENRKNRSKADRLQWVLPPVEVLITTATIFNHELIKNEKKSLKCESLRQVCTRHVKAAVSVQSQQLSD